jgi:hypothetical protein
MARGSWDASTLTWATATNGDWDVGAVTYTDSVGLGVGCSAASSPTVSGPVGATLAGSFTFSNSAKHTADESVVAAVTLGSNSTPTAAVLGSALLQQSNTASVEPTNTIVDGISIPQSNTASVGSTNTVVDGISIPQSNTASVGSTNTIVDDISVLSDFSVSSQTSQVMTNASNLSQPVDLTSSEDMSIDVSGSLDLNPTATTSVTAGLPALSIVGVNLSTAVDDSATFLSAANILTNASVSVADGMLYVDSVALPVSYSADVESNFLWSKVSPTGGVESEQKFILAVMVEMMRVVIDDVEVEVLNRFLKENVGGHPRGDLGLDRSPPEYFGRIDIRSYLIAAKHYIYARYSQTFVDRVLTPAYANPDIVALYGLEKRQPKDIYGSTVFVQSTVSIPTWSESVDHQNAWIEINK